MNIGTRCSSVDAFVASYSRYLLDQSMFVVTREPRPLGVATPFVFKLADGTPVLCGVCVVSQLWMDETNPFKRPGIWLTITRLNADSFPVLLRMQEAPVPPARVALLAEVKAKFELEAKLAKDWDLETEARPPAMLTDLMAQMIRAKGSDDVLPANPLSLVADEALEDMLGHSLTVKTGSFVTPDDQAFDETPLPRALAASTPSGPATSPPPTPAASASPPSSTAPGASPSPLPAATKPPIPPRPIPSSKTPKIQIPPIRPLATPPMGVSVVPALADAAVPTSTVDSPSKAVRQLPVVKAASQQVRDRPTDAMVPLFIGAEKVQPPRVDPDPTPAPVDAVAVDEQLAKPAPKTSTDSASAPAEAPRAARDTISGDPATGLAAPDSTVAASAPGDAAATAPRAARDTISGGDLATGLTAADSPVAASSPGDAAATAPRAARDTISGGDPATGLAAPDSPVVASSPGDAAATAPRAARDTTSGGDRGTDEVPALVTDRPPQTDASPDGAKRDDNTVDSMPAIGDPAKRDDNTVDAMPAIGTEPAKRDDNTLDSMPAIGDDSALASADGSTDERAERSMPTEAMPPLVVEPESPADVSAAGASPAAAPPVGASPAASRDERTARAMMATDAMPPLAVAPPPGFATPPEMPAAGPVATMFAGQGLPATAAELGGHASASAPALTAPSHPSASAWSRLASWSRQGPSRVVLAIAAIAIAILVWKLVASDKPATTSAAPGPAAEAREPSHRAPPAADPAGSAGSATAPGNEVADNAAGSAAPSPEAIPTTFGAGSAAPTTEPTADATPGATTSSAAPVDPKGKADTLHTLYISTLPQGAEVFMNGKRLGMTPVIAKMRPGAPVKLSVEKRGFQTITKKYTSTQPKSGIRFKLVKSCTGLGCM